MIEYRNWLYKIVCKWTDKETADDVVQEAYLSLLKRPRKCESEKHLKRLLVVVARRRLIDKWQKPGLPVDGNFLCENIAAKQNVDWEKIPEYITDAINQLPKAFRETVRLVLLEGFTHQEAADKMGVSIGTVLSRVSRSKERLRKTLRNEQERHPLLNTRS